MSYKIACMHAGGQVELEFHGVTVRGGSKATRHSPAESPTVDFDDAELLWDELDRNLDAETVFSAHDTYFCDALLEEYADRNDPRNRNMPGDWRERRGV